MKFTKRIMRKEGLENITLVTYKEVEATDLIIFKRDGKKANLFKTERSRKSWRAIISHHLKGHGT